MQTKLEDLTEDELRQFKDDVEQHYRVEWLAGSKMLSPRIPSVLVWEGKQMEEDAVGKIKGLIGDSWRRLYDKPTTTTTVTSTIDPAAAPTNIDAIKRLTEDMGRQINREKERMFMDALTGTDTSVQGKGKQTTEARLDELAGILMDLQKQFRKVQTEFTDTKAGLHRQLTALRSDFVKADSDLAKRIDDIADTVNKFNPNFGRF